MVQLTETGRSVFDSLDESGRAIFGSLTETGYRVGLLDIPISELGSGIESISFMKDLAISELGSGAETVQLNKDLIASDAGSGAEIINILNGKSSSDLGSGIESLSFLKDFTIAESGIGIETIERLEYALRQSFYYAKLGATVLNSPTQPDFSISETLCNIPRFEFSIVNDATNQAAIEANLTEDFSIWRTTTPGNDQLLLTGSIDCDGIEYLSRERLRLSGFASMIDLQNANYQYLAAADASNADTVFNYDSSGPTYTDYTTAASNDTDSDVILTFDTSDILYIGFHKPFFALKLKYSTKGVQAASTTVVIEYSKGSGTWDTLDCIDDTRAFTKTLGTYFLELGNKPSDWAKDTVNSQSKYWVRFRVSAGSYSTPPKLDRIWVADIDINRVLLIDVAASTILADILSGTDFTLGSCPATTLPGYCAEYESKLRCIAGLADALAWTDTDGDKHCYEWYIAPDKKVHIVQERGSVQGDISQDFTMLSCRQKYGQIANRVYCLGQGDGVNQKRAIIESQTSQDTYGTRFTVVPKLMEQKYLSIKDQAQKFITDSKAVQREIKGSIRTDLFYDYGINVGDKLTITQSDWNLDGSEQYKIKRVDVGPKLTTMDIGTDSFHLDNFQSQISKRMQISDVYMKGAVQVFQFNGEEQFERTGDADVIPAELKVNFPSADIKAINRATLHYQVLEYETYTDTDGTVDIDDLPIPEKDLGDKTVPNKDLGSPTSNDVDMDLSYSASPAIFDVGDHIDEISSGSEDSYYGGYFVADLQHANVQDYLTGACETPYDCVSCGLVTAYTGPVTLPKSHGHTTLLDEEMDSHSSEDDQYIDTLAAIKEGVRDPGWKTITIIEDTSPRKRNLNPFNRKKKKDRELVIKNYTGVRAVKSGEGTRSITKEITVPGDVKVRGRSSGGQREIIIGVPGATRGFEEIRALSYSIRGLVNLDHGHTVPLSTHNHPDITIGAHDHDPITGGTGTASISLGITQDADQPTVNVYINDVLFPSGPYDGEQTFDITGYLSLAATNTIKIQPPTGQNKRGRIQLDCSCHCFTLAK